MKKKGRGVNDHRSSANNIEIVRWNHNPVVTVGSNAYGLLPLGQVKRRKKGQGNINVEQPAIIAHYNWCMGGVDLVDRVPMVKNWTGHLLETLRTSDLYIAGTFTAYRLGKPRNRNCIGVR